MSIRRKIFERETDSLFMEWQYDLATNSPTAEAKKQQWLIAIAEVKQNNPLIGE